MKLLFIFINNFCVFLTLRQYCFGTSAPTSFLTEPVKMATAISKKRKVCVEITKLCVPWSTNYGHCDNTWYVLYMVCDYCRQIGCRKCLIGMDIYRLYMTTRCNTCRCVVFLVGVWQQHLSFSLVKGYVWPVARCVKSLCGNRMPLERNCALFSCTLRMYLIIASLIRDAFPNCHFSGFIAVREMSGRNKISQGQGILQSVREILTFGKIKNVMEFHIMSGKINILDNITLQPPRISTN